MGDGSTNTAPTPDADAAFARLQARARKSADAHLQDLRSLPSIRTAAAADPFPEGT